MEKEVKYEAYDYWGKRRMFSKTVYEDNGEIPKLGYLIGSTIINVVMFIPLTIFLIGSMISEKFQWRRGKSFFNKALLR